jgi:hypothetical protein
MKRIQRVLMCKPIVIETVKKEVDDLNRGKQENIMIQIKGIENVQMIYR